MIGQKHMAAMNGSLLGQFPTPETIESSARKRDLPDNADSLLSSTVLQEAAGNSTEKQAQSGTLNFREQVFSLGAAPQEAGEQVGFHTRYESSQIGQSGTIFDGYKHQRDKGLDKAHQQVEGFKQPKTQSFPEQIVSTPTVAYEKHKAERLQTLRQEAIALGRRTKSQATGRVNTLHLQTEQTVDSPVGTMDKLLRTIITSLKREKRRESAFQMQMARQAKKPRKGPGMFEGGMDHKTSMAEQLQIIEANDAQHELTAGE